MAANEEEVPKRVQYPLDSCSYKLLDKIGTGVSAIVYKAICVPMNSSLVAIKSIDLDRSRPDLDDVRREAKTLSLLSHPNILKSHCSFTVDRRLWVVMPFMAGGSLQSIISHSFPDGLPEPCIAVVLKETLNALSYLHGQGHLHRDIKAGNILVDSNGLVKLADFGVSASIYESLSSSSGAACSSSSSSLMLTGVAGTPYWMAPEVIHSHTGYSFKADIWSLGITALELAHGRPPLSHLPPSKSMILKITKRFRFSDFDKYRKDHGGKKFSKAFKDMVASCLDQDPSRRPTAEKLLKHPFFKNCKGSEFLVKNVLQGLPSVEKRYKESKILQHSTSNEEEDEEDDEQQNMKQRRISGWNFNEDGLELDPVFPNDQTNYDDSIVKEVRFGGETVIQDTGVQMGESEEHGVAASRTTREPNPSAVNVDEVDTLVGIHGSAGVGKAGSVEVGNREAMLATLNVLKGSLEQELGQVKFLMNMLQREEPQVVDSEEQMISRLMTELENERKKNLQLELQIEAFKLQLSSGVN
ncbi:serine/threonine-protein kinase BLUS1 [Gastrolobium bilobum]|uniref:serine/threonine-protein kinase BLUS1 n=1 Tax=Gastrolobium bilobum TaxID=150636 RepID=UPI002AB0455D|nr:serine/threonine-protein kinase BLUS1 [Gastrolobium bilobum]